MAHCSSRSSPSTWVHRPVGERPAHLGVRAGRDDQWAKSCECHYYSSGIWDRSSRGWKSLPWGSTCNVQLFQMAQYAKKECSPCQLERNNGAIAAVAGGTSGLKQQLRWLEAKRYLHWHAIGILPSVNLCQPVAQGSPRLPAAWTWSGKQRPIWGVAGVCCPWRILYQPPENSCLLSAR